MKQFDENDALKAMKAVLPQELHDEDALYEIMDLIFDYYDENGDLEIDFDDDDDEDSETDLDAVVDFVCRYVRKNSAVKNFSREEIYKAVQAEVEYELSLATPD